MFALQYVLSLGVSAIVVPLIAVLHQRTGGFATFFLVLAGAGALVALASLLLPGQPRATETIADPGRSARCAPSIGPHRSVLSGAGMSHCCGR